MFLNHRELDVTEIFVHKHMLTWHYWDIMLFFKRTINKQRICFLFTIGLSRSLCLHASKETLVLERLVFILQHFSTYTYILTAYVDNKLWEHKNTSKWNIPHIFYTLRIRTYIPYVTDRHWGLGSIYVYICKLNPSQ